MPNTPEQTEHKIKKNLKTPFGWLNLPLNRKDKVITNYQPNPYRPYT